MAQLTHLEDKLGEVVGLAMAAQTATDKITKLVDQDELAKMLKRMHAEATQAEERGTKLIETLEGKKTAILEKAGETKSKASKMMSTYLDSDADALDGFEFLTMAEAGEVGHWKVLQQMGQASGNVRVAELADWGIPIQERHLKDAQTACMTLAASEDPDEPA
jgi:hypothetical protein